MGKTAGLAAYLSLAERVEGEGPRTRALAAALRCATSLEDDRALEAIARLWKRAGGGDHTRLVIAACKALAKRGDGKFAIQLAAAEAHRSRTALAIYLHARCLEAAQEGSAPSVFTQAIEHAQREGAVDIATAARLRRAALVGSGTSSVSERRSRDSNLDNSPIDLTRIAPDQAVALCELRLRAPSRFARASAIAALEEVARTAMAKGDGGTAKAAVRVGAAHADERPGALTPIETERLAPLLALWPDELESRNAIARLRAQAAVANASPHEHDQAQERAGTIAPEIATWTRRARATLTRGRTDDPEGEPVSTRPYPPSRLAQLGLDIVAALQREQRGAEAAKADALVALVASNRELAAPGAHAPAPLWTAVQLALLASSSPVRSEAKTLATKLLASSRGAPPRGFRLLAAVLARAGHDDLALHALREATSAGEPGASAELSHELTLRAWSLAREGDRDAAVLLLREAKAHSKRSRLG